MKNFENFPARHVEKTVEKPKDEKESVIKWLTKVNPALIPAAFAAAISAGEVKAESIEEIRGQDWLQGVETLRESVMNDEIEVGATFVLGKDGKQYWYSSGQGHETSVKKNTDDLVKELGQFTEATGEEVDRFCNTHTHNLAAMAAVDWISEEELVKFRKEGYGPSAPPSLTDISIFSVAQINSAVGDTPYFSTVFDAQGVWYSRIPSDADYNAFPTFRAEIDYKREVMKQIFGDYKNDFEGGILKEVLQTMRENVLEKLVAEYGSERDQESIEFYRQHFPNKVKDKMELILWGKLVANDNPEYQLISEILSSDEDRTLYQSYLEASPIDDYQFYQDARENWTEASKDGEFDESLLPQMYEAFIRNGALVRFVPYDQVPNEPPCAGPDYKAE